MTIKKKGIELMTIYKKKKTHSFNENSYKKGIDLMPIYFSFSFEMEKIELINKIL